MRRYDRFKAVEMASGLIGGHFAVEDDFGRTIGSSWKLDKVCATNLCFELNRAFERGVEHGELVRGVE